MFIRKMKSSSIKSTSFVVFYLLLSFKHTMFLDSVIQSVLLSQIEDVEVITENTTL